MRQEKKMNDSVNDVSFKKIACNLFHDAAVFLSDQDFKTFDNIERYNGYGKYDI